MKILEQIAYIAILLAAGLYLWLPVVAPWLMAAGGLAITACHLYQKYGTGDLRQRRNRRLRHILGLLYMATAYFMWRGGMDWVVLLLIAVVIEIYTLFVASKGDA